MRDEWIRTSYKMGGHKCIKHKITHEYNLAGPRGEIWENGEGKYKAVLKPGLFQNSAFRLLNLRDRNASLDDEAIVSFLAKDLTAMVALLKVPKAQARQIHYANTF